MLHRVEDVHTLGLQMSNRAAVIAQYKSELIETMATAVTFDF
jgi:hypothetical protein